MHNKRYANRLLLLYIELEYIYKKVYKNLLYRYKKYFEYKMIYLIFTFLCLICYNEYIMKVGEKYMNREELKEKSIELYMSGKTLTEIANIFKKSRTYITNLIKDDEKYIAIKQNRKIKVYKRKNYKQMTIHIPTEFIKGIGITEDKNEKEFVNVFFDRVNNHIIISKV